MKKLFPLFFAFVAVLFASCEKEPNLDKLDNEYLVYTQYDKTANFKADTTFYIPDSILVITGSKDPVYWNKDNSNAQQIIDTYVTNMTSKGYKRVDDKADANLGLQLSYIENTSYFVGNNNYWWWDYPGYWGPNYWGNGWNNWYYPYPVVYSYTVGSLLTEMVDLTKPVTTATTNKLPVIWNCYITGLANDGSLSLQKTIKAVNQAFVQSPYISRNK